MQIFIDQYDGDRFKTVVSMMGIDSKQLSAMNFTQYIHSWNPPLPHPPSRLPLKYVVQSYLLCVGESKVPFITFQILAMQDSDPSLYCTETYHFYVFDPLYGSVQKMLTALFNFV